VCFRCSDGECETSWDGELLNYTFDVLRFPLDFSGGKNFVTFCTGLILTLLNAKQKIEIGLSLWESVPLNPQGSCGPK